MNIKKELPDFNNIKICDNIQTLYIPKSEE